MAILQNNGAAQVESPVEARKKKRFEGLEPSLETQRRQLVLNAVVASICDDGFDKMTMRKVAERAGVSTGMLVYYFGSKKEMVNAAFSYASRAFTERLDADTNASFGSQRLRLFLRSLAIDQSEAEPLSHRFLLQVMAAAANDEDLQKEQRQLVTEGRRKIERSVRAAIEAGEFRDDIDATAAADLIYGVRTGWAAETGAYPGVISKNDLGDLEELVFRLLAKRPLAAGDAGGGPETAPASTPDRIEALLLADRQVAPEVAGALAGAFKQLYQVAAARPV
jgi:AcrR family transcriptional regulator